jgi:hypothetical protein
MARNQPSGFELGIGVGNGCAMHAELRRKFAAGRDAVAGAQVTTVNQRAELIAQLDVKRNVALGL